VNDQREILDSLVAAVQAVLPEVTDEQRALVRQVVERMLRERSRERILTRRPVEQRSD
jgi:hypothetical protein